MLFFTIAYIFIEFFFIMLHERTFTSYRLYRRIPNNTEIKRALESQFWNEVIFNKKEIYIGTLLEEIVFRLPLAYFTGDFAYYFSLILFASQHFDLNLNLNYNIRWMVHAGILGYFFTECFIQYGIITSILLHLFVNFLALVVKFPRTFRYKNPGLFIAQLL